MLELAPSDPIVKGYIKDLQHLKDQSVTHELGLKAPFQSLLDKAAKRRGWTLVAELATHYGGKRIGPMAPCATNSALRAAGGKQRTPRINWHPKSRKSSRPATPPAT